MNKWGLEIIRIFCDQLQNMDLISFMKKDILEATCRYYIKIFTGFKKIKKKCKRKTEDKSDKT